MTTPVERLRTTLAALSLTAIDARLGSIAGRSFKKEPSYGDFLLEVMSAEADARKQRYLKTRLQLAHLPFVKTFEQFDFAFQPSIDERQIRRNCRTLRFVHEGFQRDFAGAARRRQNSSGSGSGGNFDSSPARRHTS